MKKSAILIVLLFCVSTMTFAQGTLGTGGKQFNAGVGFSSFGVPIYAGLDFGVSDFITIGPAISYRNYSQTFLTSKFSSSIIGLTFNGNYHFNELLGIPPEFDFYAGLTLGYYIWSSNSEFATVNSSGIGLDGQIGGRYFFSDKFGVNIEFGGGYASGGRFGITYKL